MTDWRSLAPLSGNVGARPFFPHHQQILREKNMWLNWLDATELDRWADHRQAQSLLPRLIRRLIHGVSQDLRRVDFPGGTGVQTSGWDGIVESDETNVFVPGGTSGWEVSTGKNPGEQAQRNFRKRSKNPLGLDRAATTFVFVTPRPWRTKRSWQTSRREEGVWRDVRAYDAEDLVSWLEQVPSEAAWFAAQLGKPADSVRSLEDAWSSFASASQPPLSRDLVLAGREITQDGRARRVRRQAPAQELRDWLEGEPDVLMLRTDGDGEAVAFVWSVIAGLPEDRRDHFASRALVVDSISAWRSMGGSRSGFVVLARGLHGEEAAEIHRAGNHVLIPTTRSVTYRERALVLKRASNADFEAALQGMGIAPSEARRLTRGSGRSVLALRRALVPSASLPAWADPSSARKLIPALLAGSWDDGSEPDCAVMESLAGCTYGTFADGMVQLTEASEPPVRRVGSVWALAAPLDALILLGPYLQDRDLTRFRDAVRDVLTEDDPALDLESSSRWAAAIYGKTWKYSGALRNGLAETLGLLGASEMFTATNLSLSLQGLVGAIISELLDGASGPRWHSLRDVLPTLAEAGPDEFLDSVEKSLRASPPPVMELFVEAKDQLFGGGGHPHLQWALEILAWNPDILTRVALVLAHLAELDPGGMYANRPQESLREIFLPWIRHTGADVTDRIAALEALSRTHPDVGRRLLLSLLPKEFDTSSSPSRPRWRAWDQASEASITVGEYREFVEQVQKLLLDHLRDTGENWDELVPHLPNLDNETRSTILQELHSLADGPVGPDVRYRTWEALKEVVTHHRQYPDAEWALPPDEVAKLEEALESLSPADPAVRYMWLFRPWPDLPQPPASYEEMQSAIEARRRDALAVILEEGGLDSVFKCARGLESPENVGDTLAKLWPASLEGDWEILSRSLRSTDGSLRPFGLAFVLARSRDDRAAEWRAGALERMRREAWPAEAISDFFCGFPPGQELWEEMSREGQEVTRAYWKRMNLQFFRSPGSADVAILQLIEAGRRAHAARVAHLNQEQVSTKLLFRVLEELGNKGIEVEGRRLEAHEIVRIIEALQQRSDADRERLALLEFSYIELLDHGRRQPRTLFKALADDPVFFAEVIAITSRSQSQENTDASASERVENRADPTRARNARRLISLWKDLPGIDECGSIDYSLLGQWVDTVKVRCEELGCREDGERRIGEVLANSPEGDDGIWPALPVREVIERAKSEWVEDGVRSGVINSRGAVWRGPGGEQEQQLEEKYRTYGQRASSRWPRTARVLRGIADFYASEARVWDRRDELEDLRP